MLHMAGHVQDYASCLVEDHDAVYFVDNMSLMVDVVAVEEHYAVVEAHTLVVCLSVQRQRLSVVGTSSIYMMPGMLVTALLIPFLEQ